MPVLQPDQLLAGRYRVGPMVGQGAVGVVHLGEDLEVDRPVAIKALRPELARHDDTRRRFVHEAGAASRIHHPDVVSVLGTGEHEGTPYLVMEALPGSTLVDELAWGPVDQRRARQVGLSVAGALDAAHRLGVIHRDVKPGNLLLVADLDGPVKVADFGIAATPWGADLTATGSVLGTPAYLAPERVAGRPASPASDVYALGVVLYEALGGRKPFQADTPLALALAIHQGELDALEDVRPGLDEAVCRIVARAMASDPADRYPSAADMAADLAGWEPSADPVPVPEGAPTCDVDAPTQRM